MSTNISNNDGARSASPETVMTMPPEVAGLPGSSATADPRAAGFGVMVGLSPAMQTLYEQMERAAPRPECVFITGEPGTGKELCAQAIHKLSPRRAQPFVTLNGACLPHESLSLDDALRQADDGTLFIDEILDLTPPQQTRLLHALNRGEHQAVRLMGSTCRDPAAILRGGYFRQDLFYRVNTLTLAVPPLRARGEDIIDIAQLFLHRPECRLNGNDNNENNNDNITGKHFAGFTAAAEKALRDCAWPGNIRQLKNVVLQLVTMNDGAQNDDMLSDGNGNALVTDSMLVPLLPAARMPLAQKTVAPEAAFYGAENEIRPLAVIEREIIERALRLCGGNVPRAAAQLGLSASTLYRKKASWEEAPAR